MVTNEISVDVRGVGFRLPNYKIMFVQLATPSLTKLWSGFFSKYTHCLISCWTMKISSVLLLIICFIVSSKEVIFFVGWRENGKFMFFKVFNSFEWIQLHVQWKVLEDYHATQWQQRPLCFQRYFRSFPLVFAIQIHFQPRPTKKFRRQQIPARVQQSVDRSLPSE